MAHPVKNDCEEKTVNKLKKYILHIVFSIFLKEFKIKKIIYFQHIFRIDIDVDVFLILKINKRIKCKEKK